MGWTTHRAEPRPPAFLTIKDDKGNTVGIVKPEYAETVVNAPALREALRALAAAAEEREALEEERVALEDPRWQNLPKALEAAYAALGGAA